VEPALTSIITAPSGVPGANEGTTIPTSAA
jgi:hypothetical protein